MTPPPSACTISIARSSCGPQSHFNEWNTSPVKHCEWILTSVGRSDLISPLTRATNSSSLTRLRNPMMRNWPNSVGRLASASFFTVNPAVARFDFKSSVMISPTYAHSKPMLRRYCKERGNEYRRRARAWSRHRYNEVWRMGVFGTGKYNLEVGGQGGVSLIYSHLA